MLYMDDLHKTCLKNMNIVFEGLSSQLKSPELVRMDHSYTYRYRQSSIYSAIVLKLARVITGLQSIKLLNEFGFLQEQASLQRVQDELTEDISFLTSAIIFDDITELHTKYLDAFFQEEIEHGKTAMAAEQKRPQLSRQKIRAYVNKNRSAKDDQSTGIEASRTISKAYSGYVHASAAHIMELYYGEPPMFHLHGSTDSPLFTDHSLDMLNCFYRAILAFSLAAKAFNNVQLFRMMYDFSIDFAHMTGDPSHFVPTR